MKKLNALRSLLLNNQTLRKHPENITVFAGDGTLNDSDYEKSFSLQYDAVITIIEYPGDALEIIYPLRQWFLKNQPGKKTSDIKWSAELLDNEGVDLEIIIPLTESIVVEIAEGGVNLNSCDDIIPLEPEILQIFDQYDQLVEEKPDV